MAASSLDTDGGKPDLQVRAEVAFLLLDGLRRTQPSSPSEAVLCALGLSREGVPHPLALRVVPKEDERAWRALLRDLKADGIGPDLLLICSDGHHALIKAIHATFPETPVQISVAHRLLALARRVDARWRAACLAEARKIFASPDRAAAVALFREWHARWLKQGEFAVRSLEADLASCLTFYRFPPHLWSKIRTVNLVERIFREARRTALPAASALTEESEEGTGTEEPTRANGEPVAWNGHPVSAFADWDVPPGPEPRAPTPTPAAHAATAPAPPPAATTGAPALPAREVPAIKETSPTTEAIPLEPTPDQPGPAAEEPAPVPVPAQESVVLHVSHMREAEAVVLHAPPPPISAPVDAGSETLNFASDRAFEEWLQTYRREAIRMKFVLAVISAAGLITGVILAWR